MIRMIKLIKNQRNSKIMIKWLIKKLNKKFVNRNFIIKMKKMLNFKVRINKFTKKNKLRMKNKMNK